MKLYIFLFICFFYTSAHSKEIILKCKETTGTGRHDVFKINEPEFSWYYNSKWYELAKSDKRVAKDWQISFYKDKIKLYNTKTEWFREIDLIEMTAFMRFPSGELYLYECSKI